MAETNEAHLAYAGAFDNPVFQSQSVFRALVDGMARPGTIVSIDTSVAPPAPMGRSAGAIALTLCDGDTAVWLTQALAQAPVRTWLAFHTGASVTDVKPEARFAFVEAGALVPGFNQFALGTQEYPDRSTTIVIEIAALSGGIEMVASGPGIKDETVIAPVGLPDIFLTLWNENRAVFPRGVDLVLVADDAALCLPRTVKLRRREG